MYYEEQRIYAEEKFERMVEEKSNSQGRGTIVNRKRGDP